MAAARRAGAGPDDPLGRGARRLHQDGVLRRRHANPRPSLAVAAGGDDDLLRLWRVHRHGGRDQAHRPPLSLRRHRGDERAHAPLLRDLQPSRHPRRGAVHGGVRLHQFPAGLRQFPHALDDAVGLALCGDPALRRAGRALRRRADRQWLAPRLRRRRRRSRGQGTRAPMTSNGLIVCLMAALFLVFGYLGVPVAFALIAGVVIGTLFTPVSLPSIIAQLFNGIDTQALMAVPFFLLVRELMTSANVVIRIANLSQALVGHVRGGLAQVVTVFSMFFSGMSGSTSAYVAVLSRTMAKPMAREGYDAAFVAALIAAAATIAALVPPSIMAVVYGAIGNVSIAGLFLGGVAPGLMIGIGLMIYCYFFGPTGLRRPRSSLGQLSRATQEALLPLMIPVILLGGILTGWFTPTEAGGVAIGHIPRVPI